MNLNHRTYHSKSIALNHKYNMYESIEYIFISIIKSISIESVD